MICFHYLVVTFHLCVDISDSKHIKLDKDNKSNFDLWNWSYKYSNHCSIIKLIGFELIYYIIKLDIVSSFIVFSELCIYIRVSTNVLLACLN